MKTIKYKAEQFNTDDAHKICLEIEALTGLKLHAETPNDTGIEGFVETSSGGEIIVKVYAEDDFSGVSKKKDKLIATKKTDLEITTQLDNYFLVSKGFQRHPDMKGEKIQKLNLTEKIKKN